MYICIYIHTYTYIHIRMYCFAPNNKQQGLCKVSYCVPLSKYTHTHIYIYIYRYIHMYTYIHTYIYIFILMHCLARIHLYCFALTTSKGFAKSATVSHSYKYTCIYVFLYVCIHIYTHICFFAQNKNRQRLCKICDCVPLFALPERLQDGCNLLLHYLFQNSHALHTEETGQHCVTVGIYTHAYM